MHANATRRLLPKARNPRKRHLPSIPSRLESPRKCLPGKSQEPKLGPPQNARTTCLQTLTAGATTTISVARATVDGRRRLPHLTLDQTLLLILPHPCQVNSRISATFSPNYRLNLNSLKTPTPRIFQFPIHPPSCPVSMHASLNLNRPFNLLLLSWHLQTVHPFPSPSLRHLLYPSPLTPSLRRERDPKTDPRARISTPVNKTIAKSHLPVGAILLVICEYTQVNVPLYATTMAVARPSFR